MAISPAPNELVPNGPPLTTLYLGRYKATLASSPIHDIHSETLKLLCWTWFPIRQTASAVFLVVFDMITCESFSDRQGTCERGMASSLQREGLPCDRES